MPDSQRILIGALRWACEYGLQALNYVRAVGLVKSRGKALGIRAVDEVYGSEWIFKARNVVNMAGPWCRDLASAFDRDEPSLFRSMLAWNVLFDRKSISCCATAVSPPGPHQHTYFVVPWKGMMLAGTGHAPWSDQEKHAIPNSEQLSRFCTDLNRALPGINVKTTDILHVFAGLQSARKEGGTEFAERDVFIRHADNGGVSGLYSVSGIKFTTARKIAEKTIGNLFPSMREKKGCFYDLHSPPPDSLETAGIYDFDWRPDQEDQTWKAEMRQLIERESVVHLDDLMIRRTSLGDNPSRATAMGPSLCDLFDWDEERRGREMKRVIEHFRFCKAYDLQGNLAAGTSDALNPTDMDRRDHEDFSDGR
jgi:glycerol-3-phosphate dehydrogenase